VSTTGFFIVFENTAISTHNRKTASATTNRYLSNSFAYFSYIRRQR